MPALREAAVPVVGTVIDVENLLHFETKKPDGQKVTVATGDGFALVKVTLDDMSVLGETTAGESVAWVVRASAWSREGGVGNITYRFVRPLSVTDAQRIADAA